MAAQPEVIETIEEQIKNQKVAEPIDGVVPGPVCEHRLENIIEYFIQRVKYESKGVLDSLPSDETEIFRSAIGDLVFMSQQLQLSHPDRKLSLCNKGTCSDYIEKMFAQRMKLVLHERSGSLERFLNQSRVHLDAQGKLYDDKKTPEQVRASRVKQMKQELRYDLRSVNVPLANNDTESDDSLPEVDLDPQPTSQSTESLMCKFNTCLI